MYSIKTLENSSIAEITVAFNQSFADYVVPFLLTEEQLEEKMKRDSVDLTLSAGAYKDGVLVGFILHGVGNVGDVKLVYNAGTGVVPSARGYHLTGKLYDFIIPILQSCGIYSVQLEVITTNLAAIRTYQKIGFVKSRDLYCFKGKIRNPFFENKLTIKALESYDWCLLQSFWDTIPSWQNAILAVENTKDVLIPFGAYKDDSLLAYVIYNPNNRQIVQLAADKKHRRKHIASLLIDHIVSTNGNSLSFINVDSNATSVTSFILSMKLVNTANQYEMILKL